MAFNVKTYDEIVQEITQYILEHQNEITDFNVGSVIRALIEAYALELSSEELDGLYQQLLEVYNATRISTATGSDLDELASLLGVSRKSGAKASGYVTFGRQNVATSDVIIPEGVVISTQPVPGEESLRFTVTSTTTFYASITDEPHTFTDGIFYYRLNQRLIDSITSLRATVGGTETTLVNNTDYKVNKKWSGKIITSLDLVDSCDDTSSWVQSTDATAPELDTIVYKQGTASLKIGKSGNTESEVYYEKSYTGTSWDISRKKLFMWLYFSSLVSPNVSSIEIWFGNDSSNYLKWSITPTTLQDGWNRIFLDPENSTYVGYPKIDDLKYFRIKIITTSTGVTFTNDNIRLDLLGIVDYEDYEGDMLEFINKPDNSTTFYVNYKPLSVEVYVESENVGTKYNVASHKINYIITQITGIDFVDNYVGFNNGEDPETDEELRDRLKNATYVLGKATIDAIETNLENLSYIKSVKVEDMPLKTAQDEVHTFTTGTAEYVLRNEVAINDNNRKVLAGTATLSSDITDTDSTITVDDTSQFPDSGYILIDNEIISYSSKTATTFEGCSRGVESTTATSHSTGATVRGWFKSDVDFTITNDNTIKWIGTTPPDGVDFEVTYSYRWLGHINIYVVGNTALTDEQQTEVNNLIENDLKAAGVYYSLETPVYVDVNVTVSLKLKEGYIFDEVKKDVLDTLRDKLNSYGIGESVYLSQLYDVIHNVEGVLYAQITSPSTDVSISENEVARAGSIIINQI